MHELKNRPVEDSTELIEDLAQANVKIQKLEAELKMREGNDKVVDPGENKKAIIDDVTVKKAPESGDSGSEVRYFEKSKIMVLLQAYNVNLPNEAQTPSIKMGRETGKNEGIISNMVSNEFDEAEGEKLNNYEHKIYPRSIREDASLPLFTETATGNKDLGVESNQANEDERVEKTYNNEILGAIDTYGIDNKHDDSSITVKSNGQDLQIQDKGQADEKEFLQTLESTLQQIDDTEKLDRVAKDVIEIFPTQNNEPDDTVGMTKLIEELVQIVLETCDKTSFDSARESLTESYSSLRSSIAESVQSAHHANTIELFPKTNGPVYDVRNFANLKNSEELEGENEVADGETKLENSNDDKTRPPNTSVKQSRPEEKNALQVSG